MKYYQYWINIRAWLFETSLLDAGSYTTWYQLGIMWKMLKRVSSVPTRFKVNKIPKIADAYSKKTTVFAATYDCFVDNFSVVID